MIKYFFINIRKKLSSYEFKFYLYILFVCFKILLKLSMNVSNIENAILISHNYSDTEISMGISFLNIFFYNLILKEIFIIAYNIIIVTYFGIHSITQLL